MPIHNKIKDSERGKFRDGLTPAQADSLLREDIEEAERYTAQMYTNRGLNKTFGEFNDLPENKKFMFTDYVFNGIPVFNTHEEGGFPKMTIGILTDDWNTVNKEYLRSTKVKGGDRELGRRNKSTYKYFIDPYLNPVENKVMNY